MENKTMEILKACYREFCNVAGDSPCGCDACPYKDYSTEDNEGGCYEAYINDKLEDVKGEEQGILPERYKRSLYNAFTGGKG